MCVLEIVELAIVRSNLNPKIISQLYVSSRYNTPKFQNIWRKGKKTEAQWAEKLALPLLPVSLQLSDHKAPGGFLIGLECVELPGFLHGTRGKYHAPGSSWLNSSLRHVVAWGVWRKKGRLFILNSASSHSDFITGVSHGDNRREERSEGRMFLVSRKRLVGNSHLINIDQ